MKTAICFYGFLRTFYTTYPSFIEYMVNGLNADIFMFSPITKNLDDNSIIEINYIQNIFKNNLKNYELFDHKIDFFKNIVNQYNLPEKEHWTWWEGESYKTFSMFYQIKKVIELKEKYELQENIKYDAVILCRPDIRILEPIVTNIDLTKVYFTGSHCPPIIGTEPLQFISDHMLLSNSNNISILKNIYDLIQIYNKENILINNETILGYHLIKNNIEIIKNQFTTHQLIREP